jgi:hypothetical protein
MILILTYLEFPGQTGLSVLASFLEISAKAKFPTLHSRKRNKEWGTAAVETSGTSSKDPLRGIGYPMIYKL